MQKEFKNRFLREYQEHIRGKFFKLTILIFIVAVCSAYILGFYMGVDYTLNKATEFTVEVLEQLGIETQITAMVREAAARYGYSGAINRAWNLNTSID